MAQDTIVYIYAHIDPRDRLPHYVGQSIDPVTRLVNHKAPSTLNKASRKKKNWFTNLSENELEPIIILLEITTTANARSAEAFWIENGLKAGWPLVNVHNKYGKNFEKFDGNLSDHASDYLKL